MLKGWCGCPCAECSYPCALDESVPCSPDCENLGEHGEFTEGCVNCEVYKELQEDM